MRKKSAITPPMPIFVPDIPKHLLKNIKNPSERYLIDQISILNQQNRWQSEIIEEIHNRTGTNKDHLDDLKLFRREIREKFLIGEKLKEQKKIFNLTKAKWFKIGVYIFFGILYPLYLVLVQKAEWVKNLIDTLHLWMK